MSGFLSKLFGGGNTGFSGGGIGSSEKVTANTTNTTDNSQNTAANQGGVVANNGGTVTLTDSGAIKNALDTSAGVFAGSLQNSDNALTHSLDFATHINQQALESIGQGFQTNAAQVEKFLQATNADSGARVQSTTQNVLLIAGGILVVFLYISKGRAA